MKKFLLIEPSGAAWLQGPPGDPATATVGAAHHLATVSGVHIRHYLAAYQRSGAV